MATLKCFNCFTMTKFLDDIDQDEYPHKLEFSRLWMKNAVITLSVAGAMYWMQLIADIVVKVYFFITEYYFKML